MDWSNSNAPKKYRDFKPLNDNVNSEWKKVYEESKGVIENNGSLILIGRRGTGKTQMGVSLIGYTLTKLKKRALYTSSFEVFLEIRNANNPNSGTTEIDAIKKFVEPQLLVIDAFEVRAETQFEDRVLNHIIDKRYNDLKSTVIISNDTAENFAKVVGNSIIDRIVENGSMKILTGKSFRV